MIGVELDLSSAIYLPDAGLSPSAQKASPPHSPPSFSTFLPSIHPLPPTLDHQRLGFVILPLWRDLSIDTPFPFRFRFRFHFAEPRLHSTGCRGRLSSLSSNSSSIWVNYRFNYSRESCTSLLTLQKSPSTWLSVWAQPRNLLSRQHPIIPPPALIHSVALYGLVQWI